MKTKQFSVCIYITVLILIVLGLTIDNRMFVFAAQTACLIMGILNICVAMITDVNYPKPVNYYGEKVVIGSESFWARSGVYLILYFIFNTLF